MVAIATWVRMRAIRSTTPYISAVQSRNATLESALGTDRDPAAERNAFRENYINVSAAMNDTAAGAQPLIEAWREFQESMIDETTSPIRNTTRPGTFFGKVAPRQTDLTFASNVFVGFGLILTFLGLIVALNTAAKGMSGNDVTAAKASLVGLLTVAGAKFFTSVAGLGASIWLRFTEHNLTRRVRRETNLLCQLLERGLLYVSPQRLAVEQLEVMKEQRDQLRFFNTDVALQLSERIGVQFQAAMAPVSASLAELNENMTTVTQGIGAGAKEAIEKVSGDELRGLSETLAGLSQRIESVGRAVENSSGDAAQQIRLAGADFAAAAEGIRSAFQTLTTQVDGIGTQIGKQSEEAARAQRESMDSVLANLSEAQARSVATMTEAVATLRNAGAEAASTMQLEVSTALASGVAESKRTFQAAFDESGRSLHEASKGLSEAVNEVASRIERASVGFVKSGEGAERSATALGAVTDNARTVAQAINDAARGFTTAATPVADAARAINDAAGRLATVVEADRSAGNGVLSEMRGLADSIKQTQEAAEQAWRDYRSRFESVDRALAGATEKLGETLGDSLTQFRTFAQNTDQTMAEAVSRLANTLTQIQEYAEALDEYVVELRTPSQEAAE